MLSIVRRFAVCHANKVSIEDELDELEEMKGPGPGRIREFVKRNVETDYELKGVLGFPGSFGEVKCCRNRRTDVEYAVKIMKKCHVLASAVDSEIKIMKMLDHENLVKTRGIYRSKKTVAIVMDKCAGGDLFDAVQEQRFKTERDVVSVVRQILLGLEYLHDLGIVHCDIKLANILLSDNSSRPTVKLIDFGVSQFVQDDNLCSSSVGSPSFIAPEVLNGEYDQLADQWSLGVVTFIMLFGFNPFNPKARSALSYRDRINAHIRRGFSDKTKKGRGAYFPDHVKTSPEARDFIANLLRSDKSIRLSATDALQHPWLTSCN